MRHFGYELCGRRIATSHTIIGKARDLRVFAKSSTSWALIGVIFVALSACTGGAGEGADASGQTFVQVEQVAQWITDHECDQTGAQKGYAGYGGEGMGQIAQLTFVCDNGKSFDIRLQQDGTYKYSAQTDEGSAGVEPEASSATPEPSLSTISSGRLTVCTYAPNAPFVDFDESSPTGYIGFEVDLVTAIAEGLDLEPSIVAGEWDSFISGRVLNDQHCDMIAASMTITDERREILEFSTSYYENSAEDRFGLAMRKGNVALVDAVNQQLAELRESGDFESMYDYYFSAN